MKAVTVTLLTITALAAVSLPAFAQDEESAVPVTVITNADFCALVSQDPVACEGVLTGMGTARVVPESFAAVYDAGSDEGDLGSGPTDASAPSASNSPEPGADASTEPTSEATATPVAPLMTIVTNAEFCALVSQDPLACEGVVTETGAARVVPEAFAAVFDDGADQAGTEAAPTGPGTLGDTLSRDDLELTLLKAAWKPDISDSFYQPGKGQKYVSFLVRYKALEDGADYNITFWDALDKAGTRYEAQVLGQITPDLKVGELAKGEKAQGWVTYEVPNDVNQLQLIESQVLKDDLTWTVKR